MERISLNSWQLKLLAMATMLVDHIGAILFPHLIFLRMVGRISFPIFCFLLAEGVAHTSDRVRYLSRIVAFAVISEIPYNFVFFGSLFYPGSQNVLFELALGVIGIILIEKIRIRVFGMLAALLIAGFAWLFHVDYGAYGVLLMFLFYWGRESSGQIRPATLLVFLAFTLLYSLPSEILGRMGGLFAYSVQSYAMFAAFPLALYSGKRGPRRWKYFFYLFYPLHIFFFSILKSVLYGF